MRNTIFGLLIAPLIPAVLFGGSDVFFDSEVAIIDDPFGLFVIVYVSLASYLWMLCLGVPVHISLRYFKCRSWWHYCVGGQVAALPVYLLLSEEIFGDFSWYEIGALLIPSIVFVTFWAVAVRPGPSTPQ